MVALAVLGSVLALDILDGTVVNVAVPSIQRGLGASDATIQWLIAGYSLGFALFLVIGGRLGDSFGYRRMFVFGVGGFTLASLACGLAGSPEVLIASRVVQGAMAAMMAPQGMALVQVLYLPHERTVAMGVFGTIGGLSAVLGPILGGFLIQADLFGLGWRPIFLINAPIGLLALLCGQLLLPGGRSTHPTRPDWFGAALLAPSLFLLLFPLIQGRELGWPPWLLCMLGAAIPAAFVFIRHVEATSARGGGPLVAPELFHVRTFVVGMALSLTFASAVSGYLLVFTLMLQQGLRCSALDTALASIPFAAAVGFSIGFISRKMSRRLGRSLITIGAAMMAFGLVAIGAAIRLTPGLTQFWALAPLLAIAGAGMGLVTGPLTPIVLGDVDLRHAGAASGVLSSVQQFGSALGVALSGSIFFAALDPADPSQFLPAFRSALGLEIGVLIAVAALSRLLPRSGRFMRPDHGARGAPQLGR
jgi:EmrB/QacA subfamily drug resistance transporter